MRTIKFRAWVKPTKKEKGEMFRVVMISWIANGEVILSGRGGSVSLKDCEIMQFTGLKDKKGVEIFEGDIIKYKAFYSKEYIFEVKYEQTIGDDEDKEIGFYAPKSSEVIGNIFENKNLIKNK